MEELKDKNDDAEYLLNDPKEDVFKNDLSEKTPENKKNYYYCYYYFQQL